MSRPLIPLAILGGSDRKAGLLPPSGRSQSPLTGCKGVDLKIDGRPLASYIAERLRASGAIGPVYVAGPERAYGGIDGVDGVFDTDGGFGTNIRVGIEGMRRRHPEGPLAMVTCDILPGAAEVGAALDAYREEAPCDLWFPIIRTPEDSGSLGESAWKPRYRVLPSDGADEPPVTVLPSHLAIFEPEAMRLQFLYRLLDIAYSTRNRPVLYRRSYFIRQMLLGLLYRDLMNVLSLRLPTLTWDTAVHGARAAMRLSDGTLTQADIESTIHRIFVRRAHRRNHPERGVRVPILGAMSLARDIDTLEEAIALGVVQTSLTPEPN